MSLLGVSGHHGYTIKRISLPPAKANVIQASKTNLNSHQVKLGLTAAGQGELAQHRIKLNSHAWNVISVVVSGAYRLRIAIVKCFKCFAVINLMCLAIVGPFCWALYLSPVAFVQMNGVSLWVSVASTPKYIQHATASTHNIGLNCR